MLLHQPEEFHGGFGMLTQSGIPKPVYHAMKMLADAGDQRIDLGGDATWGEIGIAAFKGNDAIQVLVFRQKMKNWIYLKKRLRFRLKYRMRYQKYFCGGLIKSMEILCWYGNRWANLWI